jgi:site-specific recombinase XerD
MAAVSTTGHSVVQHSPVSDATLADPHAVAAAWWRWLQRTPLAETSKRTYDSEVRGFATWLAGQTKHDPVEVFTDPLTRDYAVKDYRRHLLAVTKRAPKGVDSMLTAVGSLFGWLGLGVPEVPRAAGKRRTAPRALDEDGMRDLLRAAARRGPRDLALVSLGVFAGLRVSELVALDLDDYGISERKGHVQVRAGKGDKPRTVPLNQQTRDAVRGWELERRTWAGSDGPALFITRRGDRLAVRSARAVVTTAGKAAGLDAHPHLLRHSFGTALVRAGTDIATVADLMGHSDINTTRGYARPTVEDMDAAVERFAVDY